MTIAAGTSGFSYDAWKGVFYPEGLPAKRRLACYAEQLPAVEINNTFYRMPRRSVLEGWADQVPEAFRFAIKASRRITHFKRLRDVQEETAYLLDVTSVLGPRLGALLFQLPPKLEADPERLAVFLELLPEGTPAVFEFRHPSWDDDAVRALLLARSLGLVVTDSDETPADDVAIRASRAYLRLRRSDYDDDALRGWATRVVASGSDALVFFKHEDAGAGPRMARRFLDLAAEAAAARAPRKAAAAARKRASGAGPEAG